jgi:hypothetical protein
LLAVANDDADKQRKARHFRAQNTFCGLGKQMPIFAHPDEKSPVTRLPRGASLKLLGSNGGWAAIELNADGLIDGYCALNQISARMPEPLPHCARG